MGSILFEKKNVQVNRLLPRSIHHTINKNCLDQITFYVTVPSHKNDYFINLTNKIIHLNEIFLIYGCVSYDILSIILIDYNYSEIQFTGLNQLYSYIYFKHKYNFIVTSMMRYFKLCLSAFVV